MATAPLAQGGPREQRVDSPSLAKRGHRPSYAAALEALVLDAERKRRDSLREKAKGLRAVFSSALRRELAELEEEQRERHVSLVQQFQLRRFDDIQTVDKVAQSREQQLMRGMRYLLSPHTLFVRAWELFTMALVCYQAVFIPFVLAFSPSEVLESSSWEVAELAIDCFFLCDVVVRFNIALVVPSKSLGEPSTVITDRGKIARAYVTSWFLIDFVSSLPVSRIAALMTGSGDSGDLQALGLLKALRLVKMLRLLRLLRLSAHFARWLQFSRHANLLRLVRLLLLIVVLTHFMACVWEAITRGGPWEARYGSPDGTTFDRFITAFWACLLLFMGSDVFPVTDTEKLFASVAVFMGAIILAIVFGNVAILIRNFTANATNYQTKMTSLFESMTHLGLPTPLQERIQRYYEYVWATHHTLTGDLTSFLPELSENLASEVYLFLRTDLVTRTPFFRYCSAEVVKALVLAMELEVYLPNDYVIRLGDIGTSCFFLQHGRCFVTIPDTSSRRSPGASPGGTGAGAPAVRGDDCVREKTVKWLEAGSFFGDVGLLFDVKRTANVRAESYCQVCILTRARFQAIAEDHAEVRDIITQAMQDANYEQVARTDDQMYSPVVNRGKSLDDDPNFVAMLLDQIEAAERAEDDWRQGTQARIARLESALEELPRTGSGRAKAAEPLTPQLLRPAVAGVVLQGTAMTSTASAAQAKRSPLAVAAAAASASVSASEGDDGDGDLSASSASGTDCDDASAAPKRARRRRRRNHRERRETPRGILDQLGPKLAAHEAPAEDDFVAVMPVNVARAPSPEGSPSPVFRTRSLRQAAKSTRDMGGLVL